METRLLILRKEKTIGCDYTIACGKDYKFSTIDSEKSLQDYVDELALISFSELGCLSDFISENELDIKESEITKEILIETISLEEEPDIVSDLEELIVINLTTSEEYNVDLEVYKEMILSFKKKSKIQEKNNDELEFKRLAEKLGKKI